MMAVFIRVNFLTTKFKEMELILGIKIKNTLVNGKIIRCMVKEKSYGKMDKFMKDNIKTIKNMGLEFLFGQKGESMLANGNKENSMEKVNTIFLVNQSGLVNGYKVKEFAG
jgi:hypothetical protein